jgi:chemotaxis protein histidine kinase CheA
LAYGIIDPEYKTWFARKCVLVFRQLQSCTNCCAENNDGINSDNDDEKNPPLELENIEASLERGQNDSATESTPEEADTNSHVIDLLLQESEEQTDPKELNAEANEKAKDKASDGDEKETPMELDSATERTSGEADGNSLVIDLEEQTDPKELKAEAKEKTKKEKEEAKAKKKAEKKAKTDANKVEKKAKTDAKKAEKTAKAEAKKAEKTAKADAKTEADSGSSRVSVSSVYRLLRQWPQMFRAASCRQL